jgi:hypothetical protein
VDPQDEVIKIVDGTGHGAEDLQILVGRERDRNPVSQQFRSPGKGLHSDAGGDLFQRFQSSQKWVSEA